MCIFGVLFFYCSRIIISTLDDWSFKLIPCHEQDGHRFSLPLINTEHDAVLIVVMSLNEFNFESSFLALISLSLA